MVSEYSFINQAKDEKGLTLVELLIVLPLISLVIVGVFSFFYTGFSSWNRTMLKMENIQNARLTMERITDEFLFANSISLTAGQLGGSTFQYPSLKEGEEEMLTYYPQLYYRNDNDIRYSYEKSIFIIYLHAADQQGTVKRRRYALNNNGSLTYRPPTAAIAINVSRLGFRRTADDSHRIEVLLITGDEDDGSGAVLKTVVGPRNMQ